MPVAGPQCSPVGTDDRQLDALYLVGGVVLAASVAPSADHVQPPVVHYQAEVADSGPATTLKAVALSADSPVAGLWVEQAVEVGADDDNSVIVR